MIPRKLSDWTIQSIRNLISMGFFEPDCFDWKEMLPDKRDKSDKDRLYKTCAAFANSVGGFIIFGVKDGLSQNPDARLVGIDQGYELERDFGSYPAGCCPSVYWEALNPALQLPSGRVIHVISIPKSWRAPHAVGSLEQGWAFMKRTDKGNEGMNFDEIRTEFTGQAEIRRSLVSLGRNLQLNGLAWKGQVESLSQEHPTVMVGQSLTRAVEDFITSPVFENEINFGDLMTVWQLSKRVDHLIELFCAGINTAESLAVYRKLLLEVFDSLIPLSDKLFNKIGEILRRLNTAGGVLPSI